MTDPIPGVKDIIQSMGTDAPITKAQVSQAAASQQEESDKVFIDQLTQLSKQSSIGANNALIQVQDISGRLKNVDRALDTQRNRSQELRGVPRVIRRLLSPFDSSYSLKQSREREAELLRQRQVMERNLSSNISIHNLYQSIQSSKMALAQSAREVVTKAISRREKVSLTAIEDLRDLEDLAIKRKGLSIKEKRLLMEQVQFRVEALTEGEGIAILKGDKKSDLPMGMVMRQVENIQMGKLALRSARFEGFKDDQERRKIVMDILSRQSPERLKASFTQNKDGSYSTPDGVEFSQTEFNEILLESKKRQDAIVGARTEEFTDVARANATMQAGASIVESLTRLSGEVGDAPVDLVKAEAMLSLGGALDENGQPMNMVTHLIQLGQEKQALKVAQEFLTSAEKAKEEVLNNFTGVDKEVATHIMAHRDIPLETAAEHVGLNGVDPQNIALRATDSVYVKSFASFAEALRKELALDQQLDETEMDAGMLFAALNKNKKFRTDVVQAAMLKGNVRKVAQQTRNSQGFVIAQQRAVAAGVMPDIPFNSPEFVHPATGAVNRSLYLRGLRERYNKDVEAGITSSDQKAYDLAFLDELRSAETAQALDSYLRDNKSLLGQSFRTLVFGDNVLLGWFDEVSNMQQAYNVFNEAKDIGEDQQKIRNRLRQIPKEVAAVAHNEAARAKLLEEWNSLIELQISLENEAVAAAARQ